MASFLTVIDCEKRAGVHLGGGGTRGHLHPPLLYSHPPLENYVDHLEDFTSS